MSLQRSPNKGQAFFECECNGLVIPQDDAHLREKVDLDERMRKIYTKKRVIVCRTCKKEYDDTDLAALSKSKKIFIKK